MLESKDMPLQKPRWRIEFWFCKYQMVVFGGLRSLAWEPEVSPLHAIFDSKGILVGRWYFIINHLLILPHNESCSLVIDKQVILRSKLKEFLMKCIKQFTIWTLWRDPGGPYGPQPPINVVASSIFVRFRKRRWHSTPLAEIYPEP